MNLPLADEGSIFKLLCLSLNSDEDEEEDAAVLRKSLRKT